MRVSILIMAFLPPLRALISASSARDWASLHWASSSLRSFSRDMAMSCSERSSSARRAASIMARAAFSSDSLASLAISSRSALRVLDSFSSFLLAAATAWFWLVRSASVSLVSHSSCSRARRPRSACSSRVRASSRAFCMAAALPWASRTWFWYFLMVPWVSRAPALACSRASSRSPTSDSSFFFMRMASALPLDSVSRAACMASSDLDWFFLMAMNSSSFSARRRSISCLTWVSSSWERSTLFSSCSRVALDLLSDLGELQLGAEHLVLLLLEGGLGLLQGGLQLQLLGLQTLADFVNLVDGATSLGDLVHDVLDLVGEGLVLATDLIQLEHRLLVGRLDLEQVGGGVAGLLLADVQVVGQGVDLLLPLADDLVELLGLPLHGGVEHLSLVQRVGGLVQLGLQLALGFVHLVQLGLQVLDGALGLGEPGHQLHLGHLQLLGLGHGLGLVLGAPHGGIALGLGHLAQDVVPGGGLLVQGLLGAVNLVLQVAELAQEDGPLAGLVVGQGLDLGQLAGQRALDLHQHVEVGVEVTDHAEQVGVLGRQLPLAGLKVAQGEVALGNLLVEVVEAGEQVPVGLVGRGLGAHDLVGGGPGVGGLVDDLGLVLVDLGLHLLELVDLLGHLLDGVLVLSLQGAKDGLLLNVGLLNVLAELGHLGLPLLVELDLGVGGTASLIQTLAQLLDLAGQVGPLPL